MGSLAAWAFIHRLVCSNGSIRLSVNGKEVSGGDQCVYRKGYLALESEGAPVEFRNMRIRELPPTGAAGDQVAPLDEGWKPLCTGLDLSGWQSGAKGWSLRGEHLRGEAGGEPLLTVATFENGTFVFDLNSAKETATKVPPSVVLGDRVEVPLTGIAPGGWKRVTIEARGPIVTVRLDGEAARAVKLAAAPSRGPFGLKPGSATVEVMNLFARDGRSAP